MEQRYSVHPDQAKNFDTEHLRRHFLIEDLFKPGALKMVYSHDDRCIIGGCVPLDTPIEINVSKEIGSDFFLERREAGIINVGGEGCISAGGEEFPMANGDGLYVGKGTRPLVFKSTDPARPAKFYLISGPAHRELPAKKIAISSASPTKLGSIENSNTRTIYKFFDPSTCETCQLLLGMTILEPGNIWNTMPAHTHDRRMEAYLYINMSPETRVFHFMGKPDETRHLVVKNEEAVISPPWSIHSGAGTGSYTFIWAMLGDNQNYGDMDPIAMETLR